MTTKIINFNLETGDARYLYDDAVAPLVEGRIKTTRASNITFNESMQEWKVILPCGEVVFSSKSNSECYAWEKAHFNEPPSMATAI